MSLCEANILPAVWGSTEASTGLQTVSCCCCCCCCYMLPPWLWTPMFQSIVVQQWYSPKLESQVIFSWAAEQMRKGEDNNVHLQKTKAGCIIVRSSFLSCDKLSQDTEEERQRLDWGGGGQHQEMENTGLSDGKEETSRERERGISEERVKKKREQMPAQWSLASPRPWGITLPSPQHVILLSASHKKHNHAALSPTFRHSLLPMLPSLFSRPT